MPTERESQRGVGMDDERRGITPRFSFDRTCIAIVVITLLILIAYNYNFLFSPGPEQVGAESTSLLDAINESNALIYVIVFIAGAVLFVRMNRISLSERIKMTNSTLLAILASFFIFASIYYFIGGLHDTIITPQYSAAKDLRQAYGWILQFTVYTIIAYILILLSRHLKRTGDAGYFSRTYPHGVLLGIFIIVILFLGAVISGVGGGASRDTLGGLRNVERIFTMLIFGGLAYFFVWTVETIVRKQDLTLEAAAPPVIAMGVCCIVVSVISYTASIVEYTQGAFGIDGLVISIVGPAFFGIIGTLLLIIASAVFKSGFMEEEAVYTSLFILGTIYVLLAIVQFFLGFDDFIRSYAPNVRWVVAVLLFLIPGVLAHLTAPFLREKGTAYFERLRKVSKTS
jgi:hypothetical protein